MKKLQPILRHRLARRLMPLASVLATIVPQVFTSCTIEPPLHLPQGEMQISWTEVITDISTIWDVNADFLTDWYYGWDDYDTKLWGVIDYPDPQSYEVRIYHFGDGVKPPQWTLYTGLWVNTNRFRRRLDIGWHDFLIWSDVYTVDGSQAVRINEDDPSNIIATTSRANLMFDLPGSRSRSVFNNPEIFYSGYEADFYLSADTTDYDYFDPTTRTWVKLLHTNISPVVYIYLVQIVIYNNRGKITGLADNAAMTSMADGLSLHTGRTSDNDIVVAFPMRMKTGCTARNGRNADILGSKFTTFGLCGMDSWAKSRYHDYAGSRSELQNYLSVNFAYSNSTDSSFAYNVTDQMQRQCHGGIITIEIDADTMPLPVSPGGGRGGQFRPVIEDYEDTIVHVFPSKGRRSADIARIAKSAKSK